MRRSEQRFRLLVEAVEDYAIFMLDPDGTVASWNAGAQRSKGYRPTRSSGSTSASSTRPRSRGRHPEHELEVALREGHYEEEGWRVRKDGSRFWANVLITAVFDADGAHLGFAKVTRDTTERRRLEQERGAALEAVATANAELEVAQPAAPAGRRRPGAVPRRDRPRAGTPVGVLRRVGRDCCRARRELDGRRAQGPARAR